MSDSRHYILSQDPSSFTRTYACGIPDKINVDGSLILENVSCMNCVEAANGHTGLPRPDGTRIATRSEVVATKAAEADSVSSPSHYTSGKVECIDAIDAAVAHLKDGRESFYTAQVIKYVWRWKLKNGVQDLRKAKWYLERLIGVLDGR